MSFFGQVSVPVSFITTTRLAYVTESARRTEDEAIALAELELRQQTDALCAGAELVQRNRVPRLPILPSPRLHHLVH